MIEHVGANTVRPSTWRGSALPGKLLMRQTAAGDQWSPLRSGLCVPLRNAAFQPAAAQVVEDEQQRRQRPGQGVAELDRGDRVIERDHRGQPQHPQAADEKHRDQRRHADVALKMKE